MISDRRERKVSVGRLEDVLEAVARTPQARRGDLSWREVFDAALEVLFKEPDLDTVDYSDPVAFADALFRTRTMRAELFTLLKSRHGSFRINAIKHIRANTGAGLKESKDAFEEYERSMDWMKPWPHGV